jgi:hypothetical protein
MIKGIKIFAERNVKALESAVNKFLAREVVC